MAGTAAEQAVHLAPNLPRPQEGGSPRSVSSEKDLNTPMGEKIGDRCGAAAIAGALWLKLPGGGGFSRRRVWFELHGDELQFGPRQGGRCSGRIWVDGALEIKCGASEWTLSLTQFKWRCFTLVAGGANCVCCCGWGRQEFEQVTESPDRVGKNSAAAVIDRWVVAITRAQGGGAAEDVAGAELVDTDSRAGSIES